MNDDFEAEMAASGRTTSRWSNEPGYRYSEHTHPYRKTLCCLEGSIVFHTPDGDVTLEAGERLVLQPGTPHAASVGPDGVRCAEAHG
ncbi:MAG TPA: cupin [Acidimicrobiaceae bacterium]|nr:cupin [Acidimicrobiaceae bacterium]